MTDLLLDQEVLEVETVKYISQRMERESKNLYRAEAR